MRPFSKRVAPYLNFNHNLNFYEIFVTKKDVFASKEQANDFREGSGPVQGKEEVAVEI